VDAYLVSWNASDAARKAGYAEKTARQQGARLLTDVDILAEIAAHVEANGVKRDEVVFRLSRIARANVADFLGVDPATGRVIVDLAKVKADESGVVKRVRLYSDGGVMLELHDAQQALEVLGKALGVLRENVHIENRDTLQVTTRIVRVVSEYQEGEAM
jgi:phage terminase small subunit